MARLNIAMLGEQQQEDNTPLDPNNEALATDQDMLVIKQTGADIEASEAVVQETQDTVQSLQQTTQRIEQMSNVPPEVVQIAQEQIAYFIKRTGFKMTGLNQSMESYTADKKQELVKQMSLATEQLDKSISIAQEGIIDRIKNRFSLMFSSAKKLRKELSQVASAYDANGVRQDVIKDPAFARVLNPKEETLVKPSTVIGLADNILKVSNDDKIVKTIVQITRILEQVTLAITKSTFIAKDSQVEKLEAIEGEIFDLYEEIKGFINIGDKKSSADIEPLQPADKKKIESLVADLLDIGDFERVEKDLSDAVWGLYTVFENEKQTRLIAFMAADLRAANRINDIGYKTYNAIDKIMSLRFEVAHACVKYIKASTDS
jgi:hypothetical protein